MKAYAIFEGGGVKGAALAGALETARKDLTFVGFGGTSAGAMVAALACVGYSGKEIYDLLQTELKPIKLLDDGGKKFRAVSILLENQLNPAKSRTKRVLKTTKAGLAAARRPLKTAKGLWDLWGDYGVYDGTAFRATMLKLLKAKLVKVLPELAKAKDITFEDLKNAGKPPLKVVASDIDRGCAAIFGCTRNNPGEMTFGTSVIEAIHASACYPLLFRPVPLLGGATNAVDGGLASNLPTFLFEFEQLCTGFPTICFDLESAGSPPATGLGNYMVKLADTAIEASDHVPARLRNFIRVSIPIPKGVTAITLNASKETLQTLYDNGSSATAKALKDWKRLELYKKSKSGQDFQDQLRSIHGDPKAFQMVFFALRHYLGLYSVAKDVRISLMLPTGSPDSSRIVVYHFNFGKKDDEPTDPDHDLTLGEHSGCSGQCIKAKQPIVADLTLIDKTWNLTPEDRAKLRPDRRAMICYPVFPDIGERRESLDEKDLPVRAVLSVDTSSLLHETGWLVDTKEGKDTILLKESVETLLETTTRLLSSMLG